MKDLAKRLRTLAGTLETHGADLDAAAYMRKAVSFSKQLESFEVLTADMVKGLAPGARELEKIFSGPDSKLLKDKVLKKLCESVLGSKPEGEKPGKQRKNFLAEVTRRGLAAKALPAVREALAAARTPAAPPPKEVGALQDELLRLGRLDDESFADEMEGRYRKASDLKALAKANKLSVQSNPSRDTLLRNIRAAALRVASHQIT